jgi:hypothetical protein
MRCHGTRHFPPALSQDRNLLNTRGHVEFLPDHYRRHAARCMALAQKTADTSVKTELLAMAEAWHELACLAEGGAMNASVNDDLPKQRWS